MSLSLQPSSGRLKPGDVVDLTATLRTTDLGPLSGEVQILLAAAPPAQEQEGIGAAARGGSTSVSGDGGGGGESSGPQWQKEPAVRCPAGASVVACTYELLEGGGGLKEVSRGFSETSTCEARHRPRAALGGAVWQLLHRRSCADASEPTRAPPQVDFGAAYFGERLQRTLLLRNAGPGEARFDLSFGPSSEMGPADGGPRSSSGSDDPHTTFLKLARIRVREQGRGGWGYHRRR
jgi:hypothetical protein